MAGTQLLFLVQWEDRFMSIIQESEIVSPVKKVTEYYEGELIQAKFQKRTYHAVISEIHPYKKFLLKQAKLPPKHSYEYEVAKTTEGYTDANQHKDSNPKKGSSVGVNQKRDNPKKASSVGRTDTDDKLKSIWTKSPNTYSGSSPTSPRNSVKDVPRSPNTYSGSSPTSPRNSVKDVPRSPNTYSGSSPTSPRNSVKDVPRSSNTYSGSSPTSPRNSVKDVPRSPNTYSGRSPTSPRNSVKDVPRSPNTYSGSSPTSPRGSVKDVASASGDINPKKRKIDLVEIDSDTDEEGRTCTSCKRLKERIAYLEQQQESLKESLKNSSEQLGTRPTPGVVSSNVAKEFNMVEVYAGTDVYWFRNQRDFVLFNGKGPEQLLSKALDVFFTKEVLINSSAMGGGKFQPLNEAIVNACICFVQKRWEVKTSHLTKIINDKCSNARRPKRAGLYSHDKYMKNKKAQKHKNSICD